MALFIVERVGTGFSVRPGENTLQAAASALVAEGWADAAALSAATAEAAAGPTYASTAAGLAATTNGQAFAVDAGGGLVSVYLNSAGTAVLQRTLATTAYLASSAGAGAVGFLQSGTGAVARPAQAKLRDTVSVKDFGAIGDGVTDDTAAIQAALNAASCVVFPTGTYVISATIQPNLQQFMFFDRVTILSNVAGPAFLVVGDKDAVRFGGNVTIDCQNVAGSTGLLILGSSAIASVTTTNTVESMFVRNATIGLHMLSDGNRGVYYNRIERFGANDCTTGIKLETTSGGANQRDVNANHFGTVTLQRCVDALVLDGTWGNYFDFVEAESNTGTAIKIVDAFNVAINGGWIEGNTVNIEIANMPDVYAVYISAAIDSPLTAADTKFIYTPSWERSVIIHNSQYSKWFGRAGFEERVDIGDYGVAANDQGNAPDGFGRLRVAASQDFFRISSGSPFFYMRLRSGTSGWFFTNEAGQQILDLQKLRAEFDTPVTLKNSAWNSNQLRLGNYYLWVDGSGRLRVKSGAPTSDTDGTVVGTQT